MFHPTTQQLVDYDLFVLMSMEKNNKPKKPKPRPTSSSYVWITENLEKLGKKMRKIKKRKK